MMESKISLKKSLIQDDLEVIVNNILQKCKFEAERNGLQIPLENYEDRVSYYTGIPINRLKQIQSKETSANLLKPVSVDTHIIILKCLLKFYESKEVPTFRLLLQNSMELKQIFKNFEQFKHEAMWLGFDYHNILNNTKLLMEDPKITFERFLYLRKINSIRQKGTLVYYISERLIDKHLNFKTPWQQSIDTSDAYRDAYTFFHAVSRLGYTNGLFCLQPNEDDFYRWVVDILLASLQPSSVVVLDNSPLHGTLKSQTLSMYDTKWDMIKWLEQQNVPCSYAMNKCQLYQLIKKHALIEEIYRVDRVLKTNGHEVIRLPRYFESLSPLELIWKDIKENLITRTDLKNDVLSVFMNMPKNNYFLYEKQIEEKEKEIFSLDISMDKVLDKFLIDLKTPLEEEYSD